MGSIGEKTKGKVVRRGFAALTPDQRKAISSKGGKAVDPANRSFSKSSALAKAAGRKGGLVGGARK